MKRLLFSVYLMLALTRTAMASTPAAQWINNGLTNNIPPNQTPSIDALNVINNGEIDLTLPFPLLGSQAPTPFDFSDVTNYVNCGVMTCNNGFIFNNTPASNGDATRSASFMNFNTGTIYGNGFVFALTNGNIGSINVGNIGTIFGFNGIAGATLDISANTITNNGVLEVSVNGLMQIDGGSINMKDGSSFETACSCLAGS